MPIIADKGRGVPAIQETPRSCLLVSDVPFAAPVITGAIFIFLDSGNRADSICLSNELDEGCSNGELFIVFTPNLLGVGGEADIAIGDLFESPKLMPPIVAEPFPVVSWSVIISVGLMFLPMSPSDRSDPPIEIFDVDGMGNAEELAPSEPERLDLSWGGGLKATSSSKCHSW